MPGRPRLWLAQPGEKQSASVRARSLLASELYHRKGVKPAGDLNHVYRSSVLAPAPRRAAPRRGRQSILLLRGFQNLFSHFQTVETAGNGEAITEPVRAHEEGRRECTIVVTGSSQSQCGNCDWVGGSSHRAREHLIGSRIAAETGCHLARHCRGQCGQKWVPVPSQRGIDCRGQCAGQIGCQIVGAELGAI